MRKLYQSYRDIGASHSEAIVCCILTPIVIVGAFLLFTACFLGFGFFAAGVKGL
jgi:hypothetical protein